MVHRLVQTVCWMFEHHTLHGIQLVLSSVGKLTEGINMLHSNAYPHMPTQFWTKRMPCDGRCSNSCIQPHLNTMHFSQLWTAIGKGKGKGDP